MDYIDKNILRRVSNYEDVSLFAALILKVKYWGKILRSKDNNLTKDLIIKNIEYAIPNNFLRDKSQDYWVTKIQKDFDRQNLRELSIEEAQERFLTQFANYPLAYSSYYVLKAQPEKDSISEDSMSVRQFDIDESEEYGGNRDTFLQAHMNRDLLCVINFNGISFYENQRRDKPIQRINFEDLLYVMGSDDTIKLGFISRGQINSFDCKIELYTINALLNARPIAEDILSYAQLRLAESTKNESIEVVKRNIINIFEDIEDPYEDEGILGGSPNRSSNSTFRKSTNIKGGALRKSNVGAFDFLGEGDSPDRQLEITHNYQHSAKYILTKLQQLRGHQFKLKEKFLAYLRKYPLYLQQKSGLAQSPDRNSDSQKNLRRKSLLLGQPTSSLKSSLASSNQSQQNTTTASRDHRASVAFKLQLSTHRIEEDKEEDEDDNTPTPNGKSRMAGGRMLPLLSNKSGQEKSSPMGSQPNIALRSARAENSPLFKPLEQTPSSSSQQKGQQQQPIATTVAKKDSFTNLPVLNSRKTNFSFRGQPASMSNSRKQSDMEYDKPETVIGAGQQAVINELFKQQPQVEQISREEPTFGKKSGFSKQQVCDGIVMMMESPKEEEAVVREGEAMVLGQKVNYEVMDKTQKKENLGNLLSAAFNFMPPPPK